MILLFEKATISATSVAAASTGINLDFWMVPAGNLINIAAIEEQVILYFRDGNPYSETLSTGEALTGSFRFATVTLNVTAGQESQVAQDFYKFILAGPKPIVPVPSVRQIFKFSNVTNEFADIADITSIDTIKRYTSYDTISGTGGGGSLPTGGVEDQVLTKLSATDGDADWEYPHTLYVNVRNVSGGTLAKGTPVHANDVTGNVADVIAADASSSSAMPCTYVLNEEIDNNQQGIAILTGTITGVDTSSFSPGDVVYVANGGGFTNVKPTGTDLIQNLGVVTKSNASTGSGVVYGTGRSNDVPNLPTGKFFIGSATNTTESAYTLPTADGSADQVLTTNGSGAVSFQDAGGSKTFTISIGGRYTMSTPNRYYFYNGVYGWDFYDLSSNVPSFSNLSYLIWYSGIVIPYDATEAKVVGTIRTGNTEDYEVELWYASNPDGSTSTFSPTSIASQTFTGASGAAVKIDFSATGLSLSSTDVLFLTYYRSTGATTTTRVYVSMTIALS